jgi:transposase
LANDVWKSLGFDKILADCGFSEREIALSAAVIWGRLIQPGSDLSTWGWLRNSSSLSDFFKANISRVHKDRIYEIADKLLLNKDKLEEALYERQCEIFNYQKTLFLFDLTNFYFEGKADANDLAKRGKSKEKRSQNPLVSLALIVDEHGFPVKSKVYEGNVGEPKTLKEILLESGLLGEDKTLYKPILAMDRGIATAENLEFLREHNFSFTVIERANKTHEFHDHFESMEGFETITDSKGQLIHLKKLDSQVLCVSETRAEKEKAMHKKKVLRAQKDLDAMIKVIKSGRLKGKENISERIGKIKAKNVGFSKLFVLKIADDYSEVTYHEKDDSDQYSGCYVIEFEKLEGDAEMIWRTYTTLTKVESAFRCMKTDLGTRPVYHQKAERTEAHLFLSILAYHMLANIEFRLQEKDSPVQWGTLRKILQSHTRCTLQWSDSLGQVWQKTNSAKAEPCHLDIFRKLGISNPLNDYLYKVGENKNVVPKKRAYLGN